jgi:hypothetical protein
LVAGQHLMAMDVYEVLLVPVDQVGEQGCLKV